VTRIGVGGLINMEKVHQAHCVLTDIHLFHKHADKGTLGGSRQDDITQQDLINRLVQRLIISSCIFSSFYNILLFHINGITDKFP